MSDLLTVRYPSGAIEFRSFAQSPQPGDVLHRNGDSWMVDDVAVGEDGSMVVTLHAVQAPRPEEASNESPWWAGAIDRARHARSRSIER